MQTRSDPRGPAARRHRAPRQRTFHLERGRIESLAGDEGGWALWYTPWGSRHEFVTYHRRLSSARAWASHYDRLSVRRSNRIRHGLLAVALTVIALLLFAPLTHELAAWGIVVFIVVATLWFLGLHELADLLDGIVPDDVSDAVDRRMLWLDPLLSRAMQRLETHFGISPDWIIDESTDEGPVELPPWPTSLAAQMPFRGRS